MMLRTASACLLVALLTASAAHGKPLYITVPRAFSVSESPVLDVAFEARGPVELRVLKPRSLDRFLGGQLDVHRAWKKPEVRENPGRALSQGLNDVTGPGTFLLYAVAPELRKALSPSMPARAPAVGEGLPRFGLGPKKLVDVPADMELVRRQWLNLDLGGADRAFDVPGFEAWSAEGSGFEERRVTLPPLPAGVYVVQLVQGTVEGQVTLVVTDLTVQVKQTDGRVLVRVADRAQLPREGIDVVVRPLVGAAVRGTTNGDGEVMLDVDAPRLLVTATATGKGGGDTALVDTDFYSTLAVTPDVFLYTDRPIYRSGDEVRFRGIVRKPGSFLARLFTPRRPAVRIALDVDGAPRGAIVTDVDDFGSFSGTLKVPDDTPESVLRVTATIDDHAHRGEARVQEYVKPTFFVTVTTETEALQPGATLRARAKIERYAGGVPKGAAYEVVLSRVAVEAPAWVDDAGLGGQGSAVTYGSTSTTEGRLSVPEPLYSTLTTRLQANPSAYDDPWASAATFDAQGEAVFEVPVPALDADDRLPWRYTLTVRARDDQGTFGAASTALFVSPVELTGALRVTSGGAPASVANLDGEATLAVRATTLSGKPYGPASGNVAFVLRDADGRESALSGRDLKTDEAGVARVDVPVAKPGTVVARVTLTDRKGASWKGETTLLVVGGRGERIVWVPELTLSAQPGPLALGATGEVTVLFPDEWGPQGKNAGSVWVTLSGTTLFESRRVEVKGSTWIYRFDVEQRFGSAVYVSIAIATRSGRFEERTVAQRILPAERLLHVAVEPGQAEAAPLTDQTMRLRVTDARGRGVAAAVSLGVVDKAIYALQPELRPRVLDFFYPLVRDNVASFFSSDFQAYGYGHVLARRGLAGDVRFAAIKPPKKKTDERDTAYWNASIVTDADGFADVSFRLPGNATLWTATAVAADASGRFGEGTAEFATRSPLLVHTVLPAFLRSGDSTVALVRVQRNVRAEGAQPTTLQVDGQAKGNLAGTFARALTVGATGEETATIELAASGTGEGRLDVRVTTDGRVLQDRRSVPVVAASLDEVVQASRGDAGALRLPVPGSRVLRNVELSVTSSFTGAALDQLRSLLAYPYGCTEQLVSTTLPNVAVLRVLASTRAVEKLDPEGQALLQEAESRAAQGLQRVLDRARKDGGFGWWADTEPSVAMTLIALEGLIVAADAGLLDRSDPRVTTSARWLEAQGDLEPLFEALRTATLARLDPKRHAPRARALLEHAAAHDLAGQALAVVAARSAGIADEPPARATIAALQPALTAALFASAADVSLRNGYRGYPLRTPGLVALLGEAVGPALRGADLDRARAVLLAMLSRAELSTFDRGQLLLHSLWLLEHDARAARLAGGPTVNGAKVAWVARAGGLVTSLPNETRDVVVGALQGTATLRARSDTPLDEVAPESRGMSIARRYFALRGNQPVELRLGDTVAQGEEVFVELTLDAEDVAGRSLYAVVEDAVPAGFVALAEDKAWRAAPWTLPLGSPSVKRRSFSPQRVTLFLEEPAWWMRQPRVLGYVMRAQHPGKYLAPPASIGDMYAPDVRARTATASLTIVPSKRDGG